MPNTDVNVVLETNGKKQQHHNVGTFEAYYKRINFNFVNGYTYLSGMVVSCFNKNEFSSSVQPISTGLVWDNQLASDFVIHGENVVLVQPCVVGTKAKNNFCYFLSLACT